MNSHVLPAAPLRRLIALGVVSSCLYALIAYLSRHFALSVASTDRPHLMVLGTLALLYVGHLLALRAALQIENERRGLIAIVGFAVVFRLLLLGTTPIQEIDFYRYLWDGNVVANGINPYRFTPQQIIQASDEPQHSRIDSSQASEVIRNDDPRRLVAVANGSPALAEILRTVHFAELPSPYPPVSQAVFALAAVTTPDEASVQTHIVVLKAWIVLFDLLTLAAMIGLLRTSRMHISWCLAYAWCPLVLKEFANSGHLDAIALCLMITALWQLSKSSFSSKTCVSAALLLGLGIGAKLFPVLLLPVLTVWLWKRAGGWRAVPFTIVVGVVSMAVLWPMFSTAPSTPQVSRSPDEQSLPTTTATGVPPSRVPVAASGLQTFLTRWRMNDLLFLIVCENLDPSRPRSRQPWFAVVPDAVRLEILAPIMERGPINARSAAFLLARGLTLSVFGVILLWLCRRVARPIPVVDAEAALHATDDSVASIAPTAHKEARRPSIAGLQEMLEACFLTLAWFWLLAPTQNPWYWTWCLPLIPFARSRVWLSVSGLVMLYYLRFWFNANWPHAPGPFGSSHAGASFFDFVVVWLEFGPLFVGLVLSRIFRRRGGQQ